MSPSSPTLARLLFAVAAIGLLVGAVTLWRARPASVLPSDASDAATLTARALSFDAAHAASDASSSDAAPPEAPSVGAPDAAPTACDLARAWNERILATALTWAKAHAVALGRKADPIDEALAKLASLEKGYRDYEAGPGAMAMLERDRSRLEQTRAARDGGESTRLPALYCVADSKGAWAVIFEEAEYVPSQSDEPGWVINGELAIARFDLERIVGRRRLTTYMTTGGERGDGFEHTKKPNCCEFAISNGYSLTASFDVDHDGVHEAVVTSGMHPDGNDIRTSELLSLRAGEIVVVATDFDDLEDFDGDGEADLARDLIVSYELCESRLRSEGTEKGLRFIEHGLGNGKFEPLHPRAKAYAFGHCPDVPTSFDTVESVLCGRLRKVKVDTMRSWITKHYGEPRCEDGRWVDEKGAPRDPWPAPALRAALGTPLPFTEP